MIKGKTLSIHKRHTARFCSVLSALLCMTGIFLFSSQNAVESSSVSGSLIEQIAPFLHSGYQELCLAEQMAVVESLQDVVRTAAHGTIYCVLGVLTAIALLTFDRKPLASFFAAILICLAYAVSDEIHQSFVPGRSMQMIDVIVDFVGSVVGAGLVSGSYHLHSIRWRRVRR